MGSLADKLSHSQAAASAEAHGPWFVVESQVLGEPILCIPDPAHLTQAKSRHPQLVAYLLREVETLYSHRDNAELLQAVHRIKKKFGGHVRGDGSLSTS